MTFYQFRMDGRGAAPVRKTWEAAARDAVNAGCGVMVPGGAIRLSETAGAEIEALEEPDVVAPAYPETFANYPDSVSELRADKLESAAVRKPRDALLYVLKQIDRGNIDPDHLAIVYRSTPTKDADGVPGTSTKYQLAGSDVHVVLGMLTRAIGLLTKG